jgi:hypothetical protein
MPLWRGAQLKKKHRENFTFYMRSGQRPFYKSFSNIAFTLPKSSSKFALHKLERNSIEWVSWMDGWMDGSMDE